jgi:hypothetical protein
MCLGQLSKLREAFASSQVTVTLDSHDQEALLDMGVDVDVPVDSVLMQEAQHHQQVSMLFIPSTKPSEGTLGASADRGQLSRYVDPCTVCI